MFLQSMVLPLTMIVWLLTLVAPAAASTGAAAGSRVELGRSDFHVATDGERFAAYKTRERVMYVRDDLSHRRLSIPVDPGCGPSDIGPGALLLLSCEIDGSSGRNLFVLNILTGSRTQVPQADIPEGRGYYPPLEGYDKIGRRWLAGISLGSGRSIIAYIDWRTGEKRAFGEETDYVPRDLDHRALAPIAPKRDEDVPFAADAPFSVTTTSRNGRRFGSRLTLFRGTTASTLGTPRALLDPCRHGYCGAAQLGGGVATWVHGRYLRLYVLRSGRRLAWRLRRSPLHAGSPARVAQHTRTTVYVSRTDPNRPHPFSLLAIRWR